MNIGNSLIDIINIILSFFIYSLSYLIYKKSKNKTILQIGIAFGLFGISHIIAILHLNKIAVFLYLSIRFFAYLTIIKAISEKLSFKTITLISIFGGMFFQLEPYILHKFNINILFKNSLDIINSIFCALILLISLLRYKKEKNKIFLFISVSFFIFFMSHVLIITSLSSYFDAYYISLISMSRTISYILIAIGIHKLIEENLSETLAIYITNIKRQIFFIGIMIAMLFVLFYSPHKKFLTSDTTNPLKTFQPNQKSSNIKEIKTGLYIENFPKFDIVNNEFTMKATVWFEFDPHQISADIVSDFSFEKGNILKKSQIESKIINDKLWIYYRIKISFNSNLNYKHFPIEDHKIYLTLINTNMNPKSEILVSYNTDLTSSENLFTGDWDKIDQEVEYGYIEHKLDKYEEEKSTIYPAVSLELSFEKKGSRKALVIFLPLFMVFFLSLLSLLVRLNNIKTAISLSAGSASALIFSLIAIEDMSPDVRYFTIANKIYTILLISSFTILLVNIYISKEVKRDGNIQKLILIKGYTFYLSIIFILLSIYSILY
jgi:hypothetical protein